MANEERIRHVVSLIEAHPEQWDQKNYGRRTDCGTTMCVGGWAIATYAPERMEWVKMLQWLGGEWLEVTPGPGGTDDDDSFDATDVGKLAAELLDLNPNQAVQIFYFGVRHQPTILDLKRRITEATGIEFPGTVSA